MQLLCNPYQLHRRGWLSVLASPVFSTWRELIGKTFSRNPFHLFDIYFKISLWIPRHLPLHRTPPRTDSNPHLQPWNLIFWVLSVYDSTYLCLYSCYNSPHINLLKSKSVQFGMNLLEGWEGTSDTLWRHYLIISTENIVLSVRKISWKSYCFFYLHPPPPPPPPPPPHPSCLQLTAWKNNVQNLLL